MPKKNKNKLVKPFVKWAGGKRQILSEIKKYIPENFSTYYEPFLGGGAVLFDLQPNRAVINDVNIHLYNVYNVIKNNVDELIEDLKRHRNEEEYYYAMREKDRNGEIEKMSDVEKASRILYLNKTCFNGLFRVNSAGEFNVPFGRYKKPAIVNAPVLKAVSHYLNSNNIRILNVDFEEAIKGMRRQAFVYFDPPYYPLSDTSSFTGYTLDGFDKDDQRRLKRLCDNLDNRGCRFLLSNSSADFIKELYDGYNIEYIGANRSINSNGDDRGEVTEVLIRNYD
ncbi:MAG: DNA adenine methylase [bacterium]